MCGIAGFFGKGSREDITAMSEALRYRGPDAHGEYHDAKRNLWFGHQRLSILDLNSGDQPMESVDGHLTIVFNGEIYNFIQLRTELEQLGHKFKSSHSDTEVVLNAYREWGESAVSKFNGMWAFCIYDKRKEKLFLSRDRFGKKPLYYTSQGSSFVFASELSSLISHSAINPSVSKISLQKYYAYCFIPAPLTIYNNIYKLRAGDNLSVDIKSGKVNVRKYWRYTVSKTPLTSSVDEIAEEMTDILHNAVKRRMIADVPVGVLLSGGIDSSFIAALASDNGSKEIRTFSIGFDDPSFDESVYSDLAASHFNTVHHSRVFDFDQYHDYISSVVAHLDEPMADSSNFPTALLCDETASHIKVALTGDGADELLCGYDPYKAVKYASLYSKLVPGPIHSAIRAMASFLPTSHNNISFDFKVKRTLSGLSYPPEYWGAVWHGALDPAQISKLFGEEIDIEGLYSEAIESWDNCEADNIVDKMSQYYIDLFLQDRILTKSDRMSMMSSLELRSPYLDIDLVNFTRKIPYNLKFNGTTKYILKQAAAKLLPDEIVSRKKKGFGAPVGKWFKSGKLQVPKNVPFLDASYTDKLINEHIQGKVDHRLFLLNTLFLKKL